MHRPTTKQQELIDLLVGYGEPIALNVNVMLGAVPEDQRLNAYVSALQWELCVWCRVAFTSKGQSNLFALREATDRFSKALKKLRCHVLAAGDLPESWAKDFDYNLRFFRQALRQAMSQGADVHTAIPFGLVRIGQQDFTWILEWSPRPLDNVDWRSTRSIDAPKKYDPTCVYCRGDGEATAFHCTSCGHRMVGYNFDKVACPVCLNEDRGEQIMESSVPTKCPACQGSGKQPIRFVLDIDIFEPSQNLPPWFYDQVFGWVMLRLPEREFVIKTRYPDGLHDCWYALYFRDVPADEYPPVPNLTNEEV